MVLEAIWPGSGVGGPELEALDCSELEALVGPEEEATSSPSPRNSEDGKKDNCIVSC